MDKSLLFASHFLSVSLLTSEEEGGNWQEEKLAAREEEEEERLTMAHKDAVWSRQLEERIY